MSEDFPIYEALWKKAQGHGAFVRYLPPESSSAAGEFSVGEEDEDSQPDITIFREHLPESDDVPWWEPLATDGAALRRELITLAHEYGHLVSWKVLTPRAEWLKQRRASNHRRDIISAALKTMPDGLSKPARNDHIRFALLAGLTDDERSRLLAEEELAWRIGRQALAEHGFEDFSSYDERARIGVHYHRYRLGIDELWPGDLDETPI